VEGRHHALQKRARPTFREQGCKTHLPVDEKKVAVTTILDHNGRRCRGAKARRVGERISPWDGRGGTNLNQHEISISRLRWIDAEAELRTKPALQWKRAQTQNLPAEQRKSSRGATQNKNMAKTMLEG